MDMTIIAISRNTHLNASMLGNVARRSAVLEKLAEKSQSFGIKHGARDGELAAEVVLAAAGLGVSHPGTARARESSDQSAKGGNAGVTGQA